MLMEAHQSRIQALDMDSVPSSATLSPTARLELVLQLEC